MWRVKTTAGILYIEAASFASATFKAQARGYHVVSMLKIES